MESVEQWIELEQAWWLAYCEMVRTIAELNDTLKETPFIEGGGTPRKAPPLTSASTLLSVDF